MFTMPSFLALMVQPSARREHLLGDALHRHVGVARLAHLDEHGVLGEAAGVEDERLAVAVQERGVGAQVLHRHRLAAAGVVGDGDHPEGDAVGLPPEQRLDPAEVDVPLEGVERCAARAPRG